MTKVIWDSSQICQTNSPFPRSNPARFQCLWKLFFLLEPSCCSLDGVSCSLFQFIHLSQSLPKSVWVSPLRLQIFLNCFSLNHNLPFSTTNDAFFSDLLLLWTVAYSRLNFSLLPAWPFLILLTSCFQILPAFPPSLFVLLLLSFPWHYISPS